MKFCILIETNEPENAWHDVRCGNTAVARTPELIHRLIVTKGEKVACYPFFPRSSHDGTRK